MVTDIKPKVKNVNKDSYSNYATPTVRVLSLYPVKHRFIKAECTVKAGLLTIGNVLVVGNHPLVAMPQRLTALLTPALQQSITTAVLAAWQNGGAA